MSVVQEDQRLVRVCMAAYKDNQATSRPPCWAATQNQLAPRAFPLSEQLEAPTAYHTAHHEPRNMRQVAVRIQAATIRLTRARHPHARTGIEGTEVD